MEKEKSCLNYVTLFISVVSVCVSAFAACSSSSESVKQAASNFSAWIDDYKVGSNNSSVFYVDYKNSSNQPMYQAYFFIDKYDKTLNDKLPDLSNIDQSHIFKYKVVSVDSRNTKFYTPDISFDKKKGNKYYVGMIFKDSNGRAWYRAENGELVNETSQYGGKKYNKLVRKIGLNPNKDYNGS